MLVFLYWIQSNQIFNQIFKKNENLTQIIEFPLKSQDKMGKIEHISLRILMFITNKKFYSGREITSPYNKPFIDLTCSVCTVN